MKKKILISVGMAALFLCASWQEAETTVSPDRLFLADNGKSLFVTNRAGCELIKMSPDGQKMEKKVSFSSPVNAMTQDANGKLWVVCDGNYGTMYELDGKKLSVQSKIKSGATPSDILYNPLSKSLWVTQRFNNELWEIDPATRKVKTKIAVGREPVSMAAFAGDSCLLIANNLPEMPSTAYPIAVQLDMVDVLSKKVSGRVMLPNGSTDVKSVAVDKNHTFAYVTHLISRYQLPTNQLDRGWMATNTLSIIDLKARKWLTSVILDTPQKGAANPWAVIVTPDDKQIIVAAAGSQELVRIDRIALHERLAKAKQGEMVTPSMKAWGNMLFAVNDVYNAVMVRGNTLGTVMFYGSGAGKLPTASAVVSDIVEIAGHMEDNIPTGWTDEKQPVAPMGEVTFSYFLRLAGKSADKLADVRAAFGEAETIELPEMDEFAVVTGEMTEARFRKLAAAFEEDIRQTIRYTK